MSLNNLKNTVCSTVQFVRDNLIQKMFLTTKKYRRSDYNIQSVNCKNVINIMSATNQTSFWKGAIGCVGGMFVHLVIGSLYQWGIINIYITSYYRTLDHVATLQNNAIVFPLMMFSIGFTMKPGIMLSQKIGTFPTLLLMQFLMAGTTFASSFIPSLTPFIIVYGILFGLFAGMTFMLPLIECNKYFPGKKMFVNGFILTGTGLGSVIFGQFSYNFINPEKTPAHLGYYDGNLEHIAVRTPSCIRFLSLIYICLGIIACFLLRPVIVHNAKKNEIVNQKNNSTNQVGEKTDANLVPAIANQSVAVVDQNECPSLREAFKSSICYILSFCVICASCGPLLLNGNYKTYVKEFISNDNYLTFIGAIGSIGNGCSRFFWNLLFNKINYRPVMAVILSLSITVLLTIRYTVLIPSLYCFMVFLINACVGGFLVVTPTVAMQIFGAKVGSDIYSFYWISYSVANFIGYLYVSQLSAIIGFNNVLYICAGMAGISVLIIIFYDFNHIWKKKDPVVAPENIQTMFPIMPDEQTKEQPAQLQLNGTLATQ